jgi:hypothetical protein
MFLKWAASYACALGTEDVFDFLLKTSAKQVSRLWETWETEYSVSSGLAFLLSADVKPRSSWEVGPGTLLNETRSVGHCFESHP